MPKFRKKPVEIESVQWNGENTREILDFGNTGPTPLWGGDLAVVLASKTVEILTLEGKHTANVGDWIIRGIAGEFYPCKPDIFYKTYELTSI